jgi:hypothetical protein
MVAEPVLVEIEEEFEAADQLVPDGLVAARLRGDQTDPDRLEVCRLLRHVVCRVRATRRGHPGRAERGQELERLSAIHLRHGCGPFLGLVGGLPSTVRSTWLASARQSR